MREVKIAAMLLLHSGLSSLANIGFKLSSASSGWQRFWLWQILGNLAGFAGVLTLTGLMRLMPIHVTYPVTQGLSVLAVQLVVARLVFQETIRPPQWLGTALVIAGIVLIGGVTGENAASL
jgi:multidrug transporter EmrE-like cation transporter